MEPGRYTVYLDGQRVAQVIESRVSGTVDPRVLLDRGRGGTVRIVGARFYELP